jgi:hypothetical protein
MKKRKQVGSKQVRSSLNEFLQEEGIFFLVMVCLLVMNR